MKQPKVKRQFFSKKTSSRKYSGPRLLLLNERKGLLKIREVLHFSTILSLFHFVNVKKVNFVIADNSHANGMENRFF